MRERVKRVGEGEGGGGWERGGKKRGRGRVKRVGEREGGRSKERESRKTQETAHLSLDFPASVCTFLHHHGPPDAGVALKRGAPVVPAVGTLVQTLEVVHHHTEERQVERRDPGPRRGLVVARVAVVRGLEVTDHLDGLLS